MTLSWNEIRSNAHAFVKEWSGETSENAEAKPFWIDFFAIFGMKRKGLVRFEEPVKRSDGSQGFIDVLWPGQILIEHKSEGKNLDDAYVQALDYIPGLRDRDKPKFICVCDFNRFKLHDLEEDIRTEFTLDELPKHIQDFGFIAGYKKRIYKDEDPVNIEAAYLMGKLHDALEANGYTGHNLEVFLVRLLFCLFAEDTSIFDKDLLRYFIENKTSGDGSDLGARLAQLFQVLNTEESARQKNLDEDLAAFPYVNGSLFEENLFIASFDRNMRETLLNCCALDWSKISPAIFGSMFQSVMNAEERRNLGAHYTSEKNILKLIKPLFLDELYEEFGKAKKNKKKLREFHKKLSTLKFLDPACGCGNFLIITYRELRQLEIEILKILEKDEGKIATRLDDIVWINIDQFYGIEIDEWPARIAEVAMWLMEHQMNMKLSAEFGEYYLRLPLEKTANIHNANALRLDWKDIVAPEELSYILGNPPFVGYLFQSEKQKNDMELVFEGVKRYGVLDFVTSWFLIAAKYIQNTKIKVAFVSTNSISQGEQVSVLWNELFKHDIKIHFAHRTFKWSNEAKGKAAVHVIIVGFAVYKSKCNLIYEYEDIKGEPQEIIVNNITPYFTEGNDLVIQSRKKPICSSPTMSKGSQPTDNGHLLFNSEEKLKNFITKEPRAEKYIKKFVGSRELINSVDRWCLWLVDINPTELKEMKFLLERINSVKEFRSKSTSAATRNYPSHHLFQQIHQPKDNYLVIPSVSSERRSYIPVDFFSKDIITSNLCLIIPNATKYHFGVLTSTMHMAWVRAVCGRLKSDYRYSKDIVYNNFPWPKDIAAKQEAKIAELADKVLEARELYPDSSLADLYDPLTMPPPLLKAHKALDRAVDRAYRKAPFISEAQRLEFLFDLYQEYTSGMFVEEKGKRKRKGKK